MARPCYFTIDHEALLHNVGIVRQHCSDQKIMAMVKADAYGHGLATISQLLTTVDAFGVACLEEALVIREIHPSMRIVLLEGFFSAAELALIVEHQLDCVVHSVHQVELLENHRLSKPISVWLKVNTGMNRLGVPLSEAAALWQRLQANPNVVASPKLMTHFACADEVENPATSQQLVRFDALRSKIKTHTSIANSAAILAWKNSHADWVRPGIMLYGISPFANRIGHDFNLRPVMTLHSEIIAIQDCQAGDRVGYGGIWICDKPMRVGIVAIGYGDGYPRHAKSGTPVLVNGQVVSLIGRVSMDMLAVDLSDQPHAKITDPVILWGQGLAIEKVAIKADTIPYQLVCNITPRVRRFITA